MNVVFLTLSNISSIEGRGIYQDLMRKFRDEGHRVYIVSASERRYDKKTSLIEREGVRILSVRTLNIQKTNIVEKGLGTLLIESQFMTAIKKYLGGIRFDLITYSTPPITFTNVIKYLKRNNQRAVSYLQLKDIFPQNAIDLGFFSKSSLLYKFFRRKEKDLYRVSDYIGCMSPANVNYVVNHNPEIDPEKVEVAPNSIILDEKMVDPRKDNSRESFIRRKYGLPDNKPVFVYGGNLGKPQGIPFMIECMNANSRREDCFIVIIGQGTEFLKVKDWYDKTNPSSVKVMNGLPKDEYDKFVQACDVGLIFLDHRFTIPNYPSRLLSYLENKMPIVCATDSSTDIGQMAEKNGYGYWCESNSVEAFTVILDKMVHSNYKEMGEKGYQFLKENFIVENTYNAIMKHLL